MRATASGPVSVGILGLSRPEGRVWIQAAATAGLVNQYWPLADLDYG